MRRRSSSSVLGPQTSEPLERERTPHPVLFGALAFGLLILLVVWMRYDPVVGGSVSACPEGGTLAPLDLADFDDETLACTVSNTTSTSIRFGTTVHNGGIIPLTVRAVRLEQLGGGTFVVDDVTLGEVGPAGEQGTDVPFEPFRLAPYEERMIWVSATLEPCEDVRRQQAYTFHSLPLRTRVLGMPQDSEAAFVNPVRIVLEGC